MIPPLACDYPAMHLDGRATLCCGRGRFCADSHRIRFFMLKPTVKLFKCMISLIGFMILRFFVLILEIVKYKMLITSFFLRFCALLRSCTWRNGKSIRKTSFSCGHCSMCGPLRGGAHGKSIAKAMKGLICGTQLHPRSTPPVWLVPFERRPTRIRGASLLPPRIPDWRDPTRDTSSRLPPVR